MRFIRICFVVLICTTFIHSDDIDVEEDAVCQDKYGNIYFDVLVKNGTENTKMTGINRKKIRVSVKSGPTDEEINEELILYMANLAEVKPKEIQLIKGINEKRKILMVYNCTMGEKDMFAKLKNIIYPKNQKKLSSDDDDDVDDEDDE